MKHFLPSEFNCTHSGKNEMRQDFLAKLDRLREVCGFPFVITSGYRDPSHPIEAKKARPGTHCQGIAADIKVTNGAEKYKIVSEAAKLGFTGIGVANTFIHVDTRKTTPVVWTYG